MTGLACDTSVLVPALTSWHELHEQALDALAQDVSAIPAHVLLEAFSVLTRLPAPFRLHHSLVARQLGALPHALIGLEARAQADLVARCAALSIRGGAVYDALIAATA